MGLHELTLRNFRTFKELHLEPDRDAVTVFLSPNGTGKTSVLEAVYALATAQSFRTSSAIDMIRTNETQSEVHGVLFQNDRRVQVDLTINKGVKNTTKKMLINGNKPKSRTELADVLPITIFTPEGVGIVRRHTTTGPHRDDIMFSINTRDARRQASQGEQRSIALALRLAGHNLVKQERGVEPLLLLDDVFSELDPLRSNRLLQLLPTGQTLVTTASPLPHGMNPAVVIDVTKVM